MGLQKQKASKLIDKNDSNTYVFLINILRWYYIN